MSNINTPTPTITRKLQNIANTGGLSANSFKPLISPSAWWVKISEAPLGMPMAKSLRCSCSLGRAKSNKGAPFSVCQTPSIAAILAGWCSKVFKP